MTGQRQLILDILRSSSGHMTADQIFVAARQVKPDIAVGTVYRNLKLLAEAGEIRHIPVAGSPDIYDKSVHPHEHMICDRCGEVYDIDVIDIASIERKHNIRVSSYELTIRGLCSECAGCGA